MSVFNGDDKEIDFEEEDTLAQYPELHEAEEREESEAIARAHYNYEVEARIQRGDKLDEL